MLSSEALTTSKDGEVDLGAQVHHTETMNDPICQALRDCVVLKAATKEILELQQLQYYSSDDEDEDDLNQPNVQEFNIQDAIRQGPGPAIVFEPLEPIFEPLEPLEPLEPVFEPLEPISSPSSDEQVDRMMVLGNQTNPLLMDEDVALPEKPSIAEWSEYVVKKGPYILESKNPVRTCTILRKLADEIKVLPPGNIAEDGDWTNDRDPWRKLLSALASELKTVDEFCSSEVRDGGVFVLSKLQYPLLLELMAQNIENGAGAV